MKPGDTVYCCVNGTVKAVTVISTTYSWCILVDNTGRRTHVPKCDYSATEQDAITTYLISAKLSLRDKIQQQETLRQEINRSAEVIAALTDRLLKLL